MSFSAFGGTIYIDSGLRGNDKIVLSPNNSQGQLILAAPKVTRIFKGIYITPSIIPRKLSRGILRGRFLKAHTL